MLQKFVKRHQRGVTFCILLTTCLFMLLFSNRAITVRPKEVGMAVAGVFQRSIEAVAGWVSGTINSIGELRRLQRELDEVRIQLASYERSVVDMNELRIENSELRRQLGLTKALQYPQIPAEVIATDPTSFSTFVVNKGSTHGVERGMAVVAFQKGVRGLVGRVMHLSPITSAVMPIYDSGSYVAARHQESRYSGLVHGQGSMYSDMIMSLVPKTARTVLGFDDVVITSGLGGVYPKGLHIGRSQEIRPKRHEETMEVILHPIIDFSRLEYVFILDTKDTP